MSHSRKLAVTVILVAFLFAFPSLFSSAPPQTLPQAPIRNIPIAVFDAKGKEVGDVIGVPDFRQAVVALEVNGHPLVLGVFSDDWNKSILLFKSTDSSGTPFLQPVVRSIFPTVVIDSPGSTIYLPDPNGVPQTITAESQLSPPSLGRNPLQVLPGGCFTFGLPGHPLPPTIVGVLPAVATSINLDNFFTPPFRIRTDVR